MQLTDLDNQIKNYYMKNETGIETACSLPQMWLLVMQWFSSEKIIIPNKQGTETTIPNKQGTVIRATILYYDCIVTLSWRVYNVFFFIMIIIKVLFIKMWAYELQIANCIHPNVVCCRFFWQQLFFKTPNQLACWVGPQLAFMKSSSKSSKFLYARKSLDKVGVMRCFFYDGSFYLWGII